MPGRGSGFGLNFPRSLLTGGVGGGGVSAGTPTFPGWKRSILERSAALNISDNRNPSAFATGTERVLVIATSDNELAIGTDSNGVFELERGEYLVIAKAHAESTVDHAARTSAELLFGSVDSANALNETLVESGKSYPVSYTHLTLPTICSV